MTGRLEFCSVCGKELTENNMFVDDAGLYCAYHAQVRRLELMRETERRLHQTWLGKRVEERSM
jgi:hypothetical protein